MPTSIPRALAALLMVGFLTACCTNGPNSNDAAWYIDQMYATAWSDDSGWDLPKLERYILDHPRRNELVVGHDGRPWMLCHALLWEIGLDIAVDGDTMPQSFVNELYDWLKLHLVELNIELTPEGKFLPRDSTMNPRQGPRFPS